MRIGALAAVSAMVMAGCLGVGEAGGDAPIDIQQRAWRGIDGVGVAAVLGDPIRSGMDWPAASDAHVLVHDLDGDGEPEFILPSKDREVRVYAADGRVLTKIPMRLPPSWHVDNIMNAVTVGTFSPGNTSLLVSTPAGGLQAWRFDGGFDFSLEWDIRLDGCHRSPGMDATPTLADVDGDGLDEVFAQVEQQGLFGVDDDGTVLWQHCWAGGNAAAAAADLDGDGDIEVIFAGDNGFLSVLDGATGKPQWTFDARDEAYGIDPASIPVAPTVAELDGEPPLEVLFTTRHAPSEDPDAYADYHLAVFAVHQDLTNWQPELLWMTQPEWAHPLSYTVLQVEDVDGDGLSDIFGMDWNTIGHRPGNWEVLGDAHVFRLDADGQEVWMAEVEAWWSNKDIALVDADGDGETEILAVGPQGGEHGLWRIDAATGEREGFLSAGSYKGIRGPTPTFVDGRLHVALPVVPDDSSSRSGIILYDLAVRKEVLQ